MKVSAGDIRAWRDDPVKMVRDLFKVDPDLWQQEALREYKNHKRLAMKACAGPGKSAVLAWIGWNFLLTRPHPMIGVTSVTGDNLKAGLWTELARWRQQSDLLQAVFEMTKTEIFARESRETWRAEARTWARDADASTIGNALRGLHAKYILWLLDETGDYPNSIMPVLENIFSGLPEEAHIIQAGNPTKLDGPLYRACTSAKDMWRVIEITGDPDDPKRSPRIPIEHALEQIRQYGRDNPWVMVNILGKFPPQSLNALIGPDEVRESMSRLYTPHDIRASSKVLGVDVAREGDDQSIIVPRRGLQMFNMKKFRNVDGLQGAAHANREWSNFIGEGEEADACFVDATGGFGYTWIDQLRVLGRQPIPVQFSGEAHQKERYYNKRAEMAFDLVEWIKRGGALPQDDRLLAALTTTTYAFKGDRLILEPKDDVKVKLGYSPDEMDAAMLTFAEPVILTTGRQPRPNHTAVSPGYNPFDAVRSAVESGYNPYTK